jgi:hypothetical protein
MMTQKGDVDFAFSLAAGVPPGSRPAHYAKDDRCRVHEMDWLPERRRKRRFRLRLEQEPEKLDTAS